MNRPPTAREFAPGTKIGNEFGSEILFKVAVPSSLPFEYASGVGAPGYGCCAVSVGRLMFDGYLAAGESLRA